MVVTFTLHHGADRLLEDVPGDSGDTPLSFRCISLSVGYSTYMVLLYLCQRLWRYFINDLFGILPGTVLLQSPLGLHIPHLCVRSDADGLLWVPACDHRVFPPFHRQRALPSLGQCRGFSPVLCETLVCTVERYGDAVCVLPWTSLPFRRLRCHFSRQPGYFTMTESTL